MDSLNNHVICVVTMVIHFTTIVKMVVKLNWVMWWPAEWLQSLTNKIPGAIMVIKGGLPVIHYSDIILVIHSLAINSSLIKKNNKQMQSWVLPGTCPNFQQYNR